MKDRGQTLSTEEMERYLAAADWFISVVDRPEVAAAWGSPSALSNYSTGGVASHGAQAGVLRPAQLLAEPEPTGLTMVTVPDYFGPNRVTDPGEDDPLFTMARATAEEFSLKGHAAVVAACGRGRDRMATLLLGVRANRAVPLLRLPHGATSLADYLGTRVLELLVHGDDVAASVAGLHVPDPPPDAVEVCLGLCVELARAQVGDLQALRAFTRSERALPDALRIL